MRDFTKRRSRADIPKRFALGVVFVLFLALITFSTARAAWGMYGKFVEAADSNTVANQNLAQLRAQEASVSAEVLALNSDVGVEAQLRQSYGVALPGEGEIQIVHEVASTTNSAPEPEGNFLTHILKALFVW